jgi:hypothetical protein
VIEPYTYSEKQIYLDDGLTLRERKFGLVEIIDENVARCRLHEAPFRTKKFYT